jgi:hypothetical protein
MQGLHIRTSAATAPSFPKRRRRFFPSFCATWDPASCMNGHGRGLEDGLLVSRAHLPRTPSPLPRGDLRHSTIAPGMRFASHQPSLALARRHGRRPACECGIGARASAPERSAPHVVRPPVSPALEEGKGLPGNKGRAMARFVYSHLPGIGLCRAWLPCTWQTITLCRVLAGPPAFDM